jgi:hypothetical protein
VTGSGSANQIPVFTGTSTVSGNSNITSVNGNVGIGTTSPGALLDVSGGGANIDVHGSYNANLSLIPSGTGAQTYIISAQGAGASLPAGQLDFYDQTTNANVMALSGGNLGIGTTVPDATVDAVGTSRFELTSGSNITSALMNGGGGGVPNDVLRINAPYSANPTGGSNAGAAWGIRFIGTTNAGDNRNTTEKGPAIFAVSEDASAGYNRADGLAFYTNTQDSPAAERVRINNAGNVGIGTTSPGATLEVDGNIKLTSASGASITFQDGTAQTTAWTGVLCGGDYAESVDVTGDRKHYEPGDVLVLDSNANGNVAKSSEPYSTMVAGIYATKPGVIGRRQSLADSTGDIPMAMVGIVPTKVAAENGPIRQGDLLVTSSQPGYAMKGTDRSKLVGAVLGKAMGSLDSGEGVIEVLVTLQ